MQDTWITGSPVEIRYYGTWNAGPYLTTQPQQVSITDTGTTFAQNEYDFSGSIYIAGNLGVGNTSPGYKLDVTGDGRFTTNLSVNGNTTLGDASTDTLTFNASTLDITNSSATALNIESGLLNFNTATGRIGIGSTAAPDAWLDIAAATTSKAQLNLTSSVGVGPTSPVSGDLWWDGTNLNFYTGSGTIDLTDAGIWTDGGTYVYPTNAETLGNSASAGSNKLTGIYLSDSSPLTLGTDNDTTFSFNNTTSSLNLTLGSNDLNIDSNTFFIDGSADQVGIGTTAPNAKLYA
jgi:hypothetical protein